MSMSALIPGLAVQVQGTYNAQNQLVADSVTFKGNDLEQAQSIQAGLHETQVQTQKNQQELAEQNASCKGPERSPAAAAVAADRAGKAGCC